MPVDGYTVFKYFNVAVAETFYILWSPKFNFNASSSAVWDAHNLLAPIGNEKEDTVTFAFIVPAKTLKNLLGSYASCTQ